MCWGNGDDYSHRSSNRQKCRSDLNAQDGFRIVRIKNIKNPTGGQPIRLTQSRTAQNITHRAFLSADGPEESARPRAEVRTFERANDQEKKQKLQIAIYESAKNRRLAGRRATAVGRDDEKTRTAVDGARLLVLIANVGTLVLSRKR